MPCIADADVLLPLLVQGHVAHELAGEWWEMQRDGAVGTCLLTHLAVLCLLTNRVAMNDAPVAPHVAVKAWRRLGDDPRSVYLEAESVAQEARFVVLVDGRESSANLWADAWLAALALSLDYKLTTFERGFKSFRGLKLELLTRSDG